MNPTTPIPVPSPPSAPREPPHPAAGSAGPIAPPPGRPVVVTAQPHDVFGLLFLPPEAHPVRPPVVLCPPFGWEDVSAHRALRVWAQHLAERGHPTLRIDLPGTGDSAGSPEDPGLVAAWTAAIGAAAAWLATSSGTQNVTVLGIGLSGLLALHATEHAPTIGDLVLWGVPARGRAVVRQLQAFARMEQASGAVDPDGKQTDAAAATDDTRLAPGGFLLTDETQAALRTIDLTATAPSGYAGHRILLLQRDGLPVDGRLKAHLEASGAAVTTAPGEGYGQMTEHPQTATTPVTTIQTVDAWLDDDPRGRGPTTGSPMVLPDGEPTLLLDGVRETPLIPPPGAPPTFGILSEPIKPSSANLTVVFLNAGAMRRIGPNRMWTEASRRWAAAGIPAVRLDLGSLGDAAGPVVSPISSQVLHDPEVIDQLTTTFDQLQQRGLPGRFVLVGLCAGSWIAFTTADRDPRVVATILFNPRALVWSSHLSDERDARVGKRIVRGSQWARVLRGEVDPARMLAILRAIARYPAGALQRRQRQRKLHSRLQRLHDAGVRVALAFTSNEPLRDELRHRRHRDLLEHSPHLALIDLPGRDHTLRPLDEQARAHTVLAAELTRLIAPTATR